MAQTEPWFRFYTETIDDPKIKRAARMAGCAKNAALATWTAMLTLCKRSPTDSGLLMIAKDIPTSIYDIDDAAGNENEPLTQKIIDTFVVLDMVTIINGAFAINHWNERQYKSDNSTKRWREWRDKQPTNVGQTFDQQKTSVVDTDTDTDTDTEEEEEGKKNAQKEKRKSPPPPPQFDDLQFENQLYTDDLMRIFTDVTGMIAIPGGADKVDRVIGILADMKSVHGKGTTEYLKPFWKAFTEGRTTAGTPYAKHGLFWLTDWAVAGQVPGRQSKPQAADDYTPEQLAEIRREMGIV